MGLESMSLRQSSSPRPAFVGLWLSVVAGFGLHTACARCDATPAPAESQTKATVPERVPAPAALVFDVLLPRPAETWHRVRDLAGDRAGLLPLNVGLLVARTLGLPPVVATRFDAETPWVGAILRSKEGQPKWAFAARVQSGAELVAELTLGTQPSHRAVERSGLVLLERSEPGSFESLAVAGDYLLFASDTGGLETAGPYLARTLSRATMPKGSLVMVARREQLRGAAVEWLKAAWARQREQLHAQRANAQRAHGGRAPDFAEPSAVMDALGSWVDELASYARSGERLELTFEPTKNAASLSVELVPTKNGSAASWVERLAVGDARRVLSLPSGALVALWAKSSSTERVQGASAVHGGLKELLGTRLSERDGELVSAVFEGLAEGRGDELKAAFVLQPSPGLIVEGTVRDQALVSRALGKLPELFGVSAVADPLAFFVGRPSVTQPEPSMQGVQSAKLRFASPAGARAPGLGFEALWRAEGDTFRWVGGVAPAKQLFALRGESVSTLKTQGQLEQRLAGLEQTSTVLLLNPMRLGLLQAGESSDSMALFAAGRRRGSATLKLEVPSEALRSALASGFEP